jgi:hypothetical protein
MIRVNVEANTVLNRSVNATMRSNTAQCFSQCNGCATVQQSVGLMCTVINRHGGLNVIIPDGSEHNAEVLNHGVG